MPSAVLEDSEDEEENLLDELSGNAHRPEDSIKSKHCGQQSTGSTDRLRRDIRAAEGDLRLGSNHGLETPTMSRTTTSMISRTGKRSRSDMPIDNASKADPGRALKRTKSAKDSTSVHAESATQHEIIVGTKKSYKSILPTGSMRQTFLDNDPNTLFGNSNDTVAYTEQTQLFMNEMMAHGSALVSDNQQAQSEPRDSSFPWTHDSAATSTQTGINDRLITGNFFQAFTDKDGTLPKQSPLPDEAHDLIEQYLEFNQASASPDVLADPLAAPSSNTKPTPSVFRRSSSKKALFQGSQDELALPTENPYTGLQSLQASTTSAMTTTPHAAVVYSAENLKGGTSSPMAADTTTVDNPLIEALEAQTQASSGQEIVVQPLSRKRSRHTAAGQASNKPEAPISIDAVVELLRNKPADSQPPSVKTHESLKIAESDTIFAKPTSTARGKKTPTRKSKRSHTTIFEDCIDLTDRQESLTLTQQQAQRKAATQASNSDSKSQNKGRARRKVVTADDEKEKEEESEEKQQKHTQKGVVIANGTSVNTETAVAIDDNIIACAKSTTSKATTSVPVQEEHAEPLTASLQTEHTADTSALSATTPLKETATLPEKHVVLKSSPTTHSPIKISATVSFRVGLSKRQRIPSLLRMVRPAKKT